MLKKVFVFLALFLCGTAKLHSEPSGSGPRRIVSLMPSNTEVLFAIGAGSAVVGVTNFCDYPAEALQKEKVGDLIHPNLEKILSLRPDLVLAGRWESSRIVPRLREAGIRVAEIRLPSTLEEILESILEIGRLAGRSAEAEKLVAELREKIRKIDAAVARRKARPTIYFEIDPPNWTSTKGSFVNDAIERCGTRNLFRDSSLSAVQVSWETVVAMNPDLILLFGARASEVASRPGWQNITAVRKGHVIDGIGKNLLNRPTPRIVSGMERLMLQISRYGDR